MSGPQASTSTSFSEASPEQPRRVDQFRCMLRIRAVEERLQQLYSKGFVQGPCHLSIGQEAIAVGAAAALREDDASIGTYRGHGHALARGVAPEGVIAELLGRSTGICGGKGGSMHLTSVAHGYYGSYAIVGGHLPIACGLGWAAQFDDSDRVVVCFFGDGATNIGAFHEAVNLASVWGLPVIFVCENNLYMEYTPIASVTPVKRPAADRAGAYGLPALEVDGNDVEAVTSVVSAAVDRARSGDGPSLIEASTYRLTGHSAADPATYRPDEEVARWRERDPLAQYREVLLRDGVTEDQLDVAEDETDVEITEAVNAAMAAPTPDVAQTTTDVWADGSATWRN